MISWLRRFPPVFLVCPVVRLEYLEQIREDEAAPKHRSVVFVW